MAELYSAGTLLLKGLLAGGSGLLLAMAATNTINKSAIFANVSAAVISTFLVTTIYENYWLLGEQFLLFVGLLVTAFAILAVANYFRSSVEEEQLAVSFSLFTSAMLGIIIGLNMVIAGFMAILLITLIFQIGKLLIKEK